MAFIGHGRGWADAEDAHLASRVFTGVAVKERLLQGVKTDQPLAMRVGVAGPQHLVVDRLQSDVHLAAFVIEQQNAGLRRPAAQGDVRHAQIVEGISCSADAGDVETLPLR
jgi:hypothetical protein